MVILAKMPGKHYSERFKIIHIESAKIIKVESCDDGSLHLIEYKNIVGVELENGDEAETQRILEIRFRLTSVMMEIR